MKAELRLLSDLEKVFPTCPPAPLTEPLSLLQGERLSFQAAIFLDFERHGSVAFSQGRHLMAKMESALPFRVYQVGYVPARLTAVTEADGNYLGKGPGLFPDPLYPLTENEAGLFPFDSILGQWSSLLIEVDLREETVSAGDYPFEIRIFPKDQPELCLASASTSIHVCGAALPKQTLRYTDWFHGDCLADYYHIDVFSEAHWQAMEGQIRMAAAYGQNVLLTPLFTPPLDTGVGLERTTIQLIDVYVAPEGAPAAPPDATAAYASDEDAPAVGAPAYTFNFAKLERFIAMARSCGMEFFEMSHLFTQWGGKACPKILGLETDPATGEEKPVQLFGWGDDSLSPRYHAFLSAFLPALTAELDALGLRDRVYFHLTDEPHKEHLPQYLAVKNVVAPLIEGYPIMDAMSDYDYYEQGVTACPVVATSALEPFLTAPVRPEEFWVYYCVGQGHSCLSNRFLDMPGARTRVLGLQLYKENVKGFLQWGLNFYNSQYSIAHLDPFQSTDAGGFFPAGDPFILYPGPQLQPIASLRLHQFHDGLQDLRALQLLEKLTDRPTVLALLEEGMSEPLSFTCYPPGEAWLLGLRARLNQAIEKAYHD